MAIVFFDLDGTLLQGIGSERRFAYYLLRQRYLGWRQWLNFVTFIFRYGLQFGLQTLKKNKAYLAGLSIAIIQQQAKDFSQSLLVDLNPEVVKRLEQHKKQSDTVVLLTGTLNIIAEPLAQYLKIDHCFATICSYTNDSYSHKPALEHPLRFGKVIVAQRFCQTLQIDLADTIAYADSHDDIPLLQQVKTAIAVNPKPKLRRMAQVKQWEIIRNNNDN